MAKDTKAAPAAKPAKEPKVKTPGVGAVANELLAKGMSNEEVLAEVRKRFPEAKTQMASINWYRNKARADGVKGVRTSREINAERPNPAKEAREKAKAAKAADREKVKQAKAVEKEKAAKAKAAEKAKADAAKAKEKAAAEKAAAKKPAAAKAAAPAKPASVLD